MSKSYELWLHWKQGDDFAGHLKKARGNATKALRAWAEEMRASAKHCEALASRLEGVKVAADGDTHHIGFSPRDKAAQAVLDKLVEEKALSAEEYDDEDDDAEDSD